MSFIYDDIQSGIQVLKLLGFFKTKKPFQTIVPGINQSYFFNENKPITKDTLIVYYPGAFSYMHNGHLNLITKAHKILKETSKDIRIVISPANSDYLYDKYGSEVDVTNLKRFNRIIEKLNNVKNIVPSILDDIIIDMNPMLNMTCDYNFTDLLKNFIEVSGFNYEDLPTPYILCGKDRSYFQNLNIVTNKVKIFYDAGTETSSKNFIQYMGTFKRKNVLVRTHTEEQFNVFKKHMYPFYNSMQMSLISEEIKLVKNYLSVTSEEKVYTNCKDYALDDLKYIPISRKFKHPLDNKPSIVSSVPIESNAIYIDSDIFSGTTERFIKSHGSKIIPIHNYKFQQDKMDIVDIDDILKDDFNYPYVDVSERIGIQLFTNELHQVFNLLKKELKGLE